MIDIDPGTASSFDDVVALARLHRVAFEHLGVQAAPKVTGKRGIQIWVPVAPQYTFDETRAWVEALSRAIGDTMPDLVSWEWEMSKRGGRTRLDYTQNAINKTLVAPFSTRPAAGRAGLGAHHAGTSSTTRTSDPTLDHHEHRRSTGRGGRPAGPADRPEAEAAPTLTVATGRPHSEAPGSVGQV